MLEIFVATMLGVALGLLASSLFKIKFWRFTKKNSPRASTSHEIDQGTLLSTFAEKSNNKAQSKAIKSTLMEESFKNLKLENKRLMAKLQEKERDFQKFLTSFDLDLERQELEAQNTELKDINLNLCNENGQIVEKVNDLEQEKEKLLAVKTDLEAQIKTLQNSVSNGIFLDSSETDLYPQERQDFILELLIEKLKNTEKGSRRYDLLANILENNHFSNTKNRYLAELGHIFKGYRHLSSQNLRELKKLGFQISEKGKHYKIVFCGDPRYQMSFGKTCSDRRAGLNIIGVIRRKLF